MAVSANTYAEHEDVERLVGDFVEYARDWLKSKLSDDSIGVKMFTRDQPVIEDATSNLVDREGNPTKKPEEPETEEQ